MDQPEKKKRVNSKGKGNGFENTVAKKLTAALDPFKFVRSQGSGARVGGKNFATIGQMFGEDALKLFVGDVVCTNEKDVGKTFRFSIETKFYKIPDNFTALMSGNANIFKWMKEAIDDAVKINKEPMLIFKWNQTPVFAAVVDSIANPVLTIEGHGQSLDIFYLDDLLEDTDFWIIPA